MLKTILTSWKKTFVLIPLFLFSGCGVWHNFTTFFNIYYNTRDNFDEAERLIYEVKRDPFANEELNVPSSALTLLDKVEVKASKILQFHAQTAFVDDALLMLGKSFYYKKNYQKALRKFQELILTQEDKDLYLEDSLWIGKTQMRLKDYTAAMGTLNKVRDAAIYEGEDAIADEAFVEEIKYYLVIEDNSKAISLMTQFLTTPGTKLLRAKAAFALGKLYLKTNNYSDAIKAFQKVSDLTSDFDVVLDSKLGLAEAYRKNNDPEASLNITDDLRSEAKYADSYHRVDLETGLSLLQQNKTSEAMDAFTRIDTTFPTTLSAGVARFEKAKIYESRLPDYDSAYAYYMKASTSTTPPETAIIATERATRFKKYQYIRSLISDNKTQLRYLFDTTAYKKDSIAYAESMKQLQEQNTEQENQENIGDPRSNTNRNTRYTNPNLKPGEEKRPPVKPTLQADSLQKLVVKSEFDLANLFFTEMNRPDSALYYYNDIIANYPATIYSGRTLYAMAGYYQTVGDSVKADSLYNVIYENYKTESVVNAAAQKLGKTSLDLQYDPAKQIYADAENLLNNNNYSESVIKFYSIHKQFPKSPLAPKSLRAAGWVLENKIVNNDSAAAVYDSLLSKYPSSTFANDVRQKVAIYKEELNKKKQEKEQALKPKTPVVDSTKTVKEGNLSFPQNPVTAEDSLKLQHSITVDSLRRQNPPLNNQNVNQDTLTPKAPEKRGR